MACISNSANMGGRPDLPLPGMRGKLKDTEESGTAF